MNPLVRIKRLVIRAFITDAGQLRLAPEALSRAYATFAGQTVEIIIQIPSPQRTLKQNAYLHAEPFRVLAAELGCSVPEMKAACMGHHFGWKKNPLGGPDIPIKASTSSMTKAEAVGFIDWIVPWAAEQFGLDILTPDQWRATPEGAKADQEDVDFQD